MQLTNDQIKAVSEWMKEHGIDEHLIEKFEGDWMKYIPRDEKELKAYLAEIGLTSSDGSEFFREEERKSWAEHKRSMEDCILFGFRNKRKF